MSAKVHIISGCNPPPDDKTLLLPKGASDEGTGRKRHLLVSGSNGTTKIMKWSRRTDSGEGGCVSGGVLQALGGAGEVTYRGIGTWGRLFRDSSLALQALIAVLTAAAAGLSAYGTWIKNTTGTSATAWDRQTATIVLIIAAVLATAKLVKEIREL